MEKRCFKCLVVKPLAAFYKHKAMSDGHLNKCKDCTRIDAIGYRMASAEQLREYEKRRASDPARVQARKSYQATDSYAKSHKASMKRWSARHPERIAAASAVSNAIRDGKLLKLPCLVCGETKVEGHHPDYSAPMSVVWLCNAHHRAVHELSKEGP